MSPLPVRRYRISLTAWSSWSTDVEAPDEYAAVAAAEALWESDGEDAFRHQDGGIQGLDAELIDDREGGR